MGSELFDAVQSLREVERFLMETEFHALAGRRACELLPEMVDPLENLANLLFLANATTNSPEVQKEYLRVAEAELARLTEIWTTLVELIGRHKLQT